VRRFEHPSGKFWSIERGHDAQRTMRWGSVGTAGQAVIREFRTQAEADTKERDDIARQVKLGYIEVEATVTPARVVDRWTRRLENATQFLELTCDGTVVETRRGSRYGELDATTERFEHADVTAANATVRQLLEEANARRFRIAGHAPVTNEPDDDDDDDDEDDEEDREPPAPSNPTLEAACRAAPDDAATWSVYADWLLEQNDPRGEIAAMFQRDPKSWKSKDLARAHRIALFRSDELGRACEITQWRHGFPLAITVRHHEGSDLVQAETTRELLARPFLQFVEGLRFGLASFENDNDWGATMAAVTSSPLASELRALRFDDFDRDMQEVSWVAFGDFSQAWSKLPALEELVIKSGMGGLLGEVALPKLRRFVRISSGLAHEELVAICGASWPLIEHLELWFGAAEQGGEGSVAALESILAGTGTPQLRHLGLVNCEFIDELIPALAASPILAQLNSLDLSSSTLQSAAIFLAHAGAFAHLETLDLRRNVLTPSDGEAIRAALPNANVADQRSGAERYVEVGE
jgi:uncharacterized protein (TIGR02996 family)